MDQKLVLFVDSTHSLLPEKLSSAGFTILYKPGISREEFISILPLIYGIIIRSRFILNSDILKSGAKLKFIGRVGSGMENIDTSYCQQAGIQCFNSPEGNRQAVAEHCLGMLLNLTKKISKSNSEVHQNIWEREGNRGIELTGKTIGIIGFGNTGSSFAKTLQGFDLEILAYDKYKTGFGQGNVKEASMKELFQHCDVLSLHVPYTKETHYMVDQSFLSNFRKNILLLNTSRGSVVDTSALSEALQTGKLLGAGLDVLEYEDYSFEGFFVRALPRPFEILKEHPQVVITPHIGGWTQESNVKLSVILADKIINSFCG